VSSGWIVALEIGLVLGICLTWAYRELHALRVLRDERQTQEKSEREETGAKLPPSTSVDDDGANG